MLYLERFQKFQELSCKTNWYSRWFTNLITNSSFLFFLLVGNRLMYLVPYPMFLKLLGSKVGQFAGIFSMESQLIKLSMRKP